MRGRAPETGRREAPEADPLYAREADGPHPAEVDRREEPEAAGREAPETDHRASRREGLLSRRHLYRFDGLRKRYSGSGAHRVWTRLSALDVISRCMLFAATLLICFFPFLIVVSALAGRSAVPGLVERLGLNRQAADAVGHLFTSSTATSNTVEGTGYVFFVLGGLAAAGAVQGLYEDVFEFKGHGIGHFMRRPVWLGTVLAASFLMGAIGPRLEAWGGKALLAAVALVVVSAFWWFSMWFLLEGRIRWRDLIPSAIATGIFWIGMEVVFKLKFSDMVLSNNSKYGAIGIVFSFMSWLIAIGVVIVLGAVVGIVWRERRASGRPTV